jgi:phosphoenolpyruvate-protein phosphotransferase/dihydroxyacetone kinase phosphotransfer subunit
VSEAASRVGLVLVSHSRALAEAVLAMARQMTGEAVAIACAAGVGEDGSALGTDATAIARAIERVCGPAGALLLVDIGSAILSADMALELVDPEIASRTKVSAGPLVEGAIAAAVRAASGGALAEVASDARGALASKAAELGEGDPPLVTPPIAAPSAQPAPGSAAAQADVVIADPHGLHARPAARLVMRAMELDAAVTVEDMTAGRGPVPASSLIALASLGARGGHVLRLRASGREATSAIEALTALLREDPRSGEAPAPPASTRAEPAQAAPGRAIPGAPGVAFGPLVRLVREEPSVPDHKVTDPSAESMRLRRAIDRAAEDLASAPPGNDILAVQQAFLRDPAIVGRALARINEERENAALAWRRAIEEATSVYQGLDDAYLRAREADVRDVGSAVMRALLGGSPAALPGGPPAIVVASDLTPSEALRLDPARVLGVIDRRGGPTSHAAILLRGAGIPAVFGALSLVPEVGGARAGLDGSTGDVWIDPDPATAAELDRRQAAFREARAAQGSREGRVRLACGRQIELWANVSGLADARAARRMGAVGIGLLRTEMLFLEAREAPSADEQAALLAPIFEVFAGAPTVVRTLDAGGDKPLPFLPMEAEANPALGVRGLRLSLEQPALFEAQLRAILIAGRGHDVRIMLPMVSTVAEAARARAVLERAHQALASSGTPHLWPAPLGVMIEVPAAALLAKRLAREVDFFSIGTNDLTQYTLAAERGHPRLHALADAGHPAVLALVRAVVESGQAFGRPVSVCGEAAADPAIARLLVGLGITRLSMGAASFGVIESALRSTSFAALADAAREALAPATTA